MDDGTNRFNPKCFKIFWRKKIFPNSSARALSCVHPTDNSLAKTEGDTTRLDDVAETTTSSTKTETRLTRHLAHPATATASTPHSTLAHAPPPTQSSPRSSALSPLPRPNMNYFNTIPSPKIKSCSWICLDSVGPS